MKEIPYIQRLSCFLALTSPLLNSVLVNAQGDFQLKGGSCIEGNSGQNCPRKWEVTGGPGWVGQRTSYPVEVFCSPSCTNASSPKVCSLILAMHGIYSNPNDQKWLMLGIPEDPNAETFLEDEQHGGPFCISFHKAKDWAWEYNCVGDDEAHLEGFINFALNNFPIDPDAVNLHGFSSGGIQIHNMMSTACKIEPLISVASSYGSGNVFSPPTTKAAYLLVHGTHDNIVAYDTIWNPVTKLAVPSCECTELSMTSCFKNAFLFLMGERLAKSIAILRGYTGDIWGPSPEPSKQFDFIVKNDAKCNTILNGCISPIADPNPFNEGYSCDNNEDMETDVIEYPVSSDSNAGPVTVWRINMHNHDYPDRRRSRYGPTEFFFELKKFFNDNRGRQTYPGERSIEQVGTGYVCSNPTWGLDTPAPNRQVIQDNLTKDQCKTRCINEKRCAEAFYLDVRAYGWVRICVIHYDVLPCLSTSRATWADPVHWKATTRTVPTPAPTKAPTKAPTITMAPVRTTSAPHGGKTCADSMTRFKIKKGKLKLCKWVGKRIDVRCRRTRMQTHCPLTCGQCDTYGCSDSTKAFYISNGRIKTCTWVGKKMDKVDKRCKKTGVKSTCRATCEFCD